MVRPAAVYAGDQQMDSFDKWAFMTTHNWDEPSAGVWKLEVRNGHSACEYRLSTCANNRPSGAQLVQRTSDFSVTISEINCCP